VTYARGRGAGRELIGSAFIAVMPKGHRGVFKRVGVARLPIREVFGPSLVSLFDTVPGLDRETRERAADILAKRLDHEARFAIAKAAAGSVAAA
jgi:hypothetical protein